VALMEIPFALSTSYRGKVSISFQEGLSTSFRNVNIIISMHSDSSLFENVYCSVSIGEECSLSLESPLSNKKWDKAIKGLTKNKLARVEKTDTSLLVTLV